MKNRLLDPLVSADVDVRDCPLPRELFIKILMTDMGLSREHATALVDDVIGGIGRVH